MSNSLVSEKIRTIMNDRNISIQDLSQRSGLTEGAINIVLKSDKIPSLAPLIKIARGLGVRPGTFLDDSEQLGPVIYRKNDDSQPASFSSQLSEQNSHLAFYSLAGNKSGRHFEPFLIDIFPSENKDVTLSSHEGEEFLYVLSGSINISYGNEIHTLNQGDSIYYDSIVDHLVSSANNQSAKILAVVYTPF